MSKSDSLLGRWARFVHNNAICVLACCTLSILLLCLVAIRTEKLDSDLMNWVQRSSRIETELNHAVKSTREGSGSIGQMLIQTPRDPSQRSGSAADLLSVEALMVHLEAMAIATHVTVDMHDISWSLKDICFTPGLPDFDGPNLNMMMDSIMPCAIKTPLDCFWEGAKILGPEQPIRLSSIGPALKWTSINPIIMVEAEQMNHPHASVPYQSLIDWMRRVGISTGYQLKPCLDPTDPNCPMTAPNKASGQSPDVASYLKGGCRGLAAKQMHWHEDEIVGGMIKSESGDIISARGLQSTIQLMGEKDLYELWRKSSKVENINNWSVEKAKIVLETWQDRFKQELDQFTRQSNASQPYNIHAMTSDSMLDPIDHNSLREPTNFLICFILMTIMSCLIYPSFATKSKQESSDTDQSDTSDNEESAPNTKKQAVNSSLTHSGTKAMKNIILAVVASIYIGLIFIASLGVSLSLDLPINIATSQILPPIALYYGFSIFNTIIHIYAEKYNQVSRTSLTRECLNEFLPVVSIQTVSYVIAFTIATTIPVPATRVLAFQAIIFVLIVSLGAIFIVPTIMILLFETDQTDRGTSRLYTVSRGDLEANGGRVSIEDQIFSRIQDDLKSIRTDSRQGSDSINFSAQLEVNGLRTSFRVSAPIASRSEAQPKTRKPPPKMESEPTKSSYVKWDANGPMLSKEPPDNEFESKEIFFKEKPNIDRSPLKLLTANKLVQATVIILFAFVFAGLLSFVPKIKHGLSIKDIVRHESPEYESWSIQEQHFPIYNTFLVTKGNFDYPNNQKLLLDYYRSMEHVEGVIRDNGTSQSKFWLVAFRNWLLELQEKFDIDRNKSAISSDGWSANADDASKLAYKLLAQTGRVDNPVDKSLVETNRLVDSNDIINPRAFYHYLSAWIAYDPFSYATTEANFEPEPKAIPGKLDELKMDKARPLISAHIPLLIKLPTDRDNLKTIMEIRRISQSFEQLGLPNFPTGIPFIFWDQFINIDLLLFISLLIGTLSMLLVVGMILSDCKLATIVTFPAALTVLELYGFMGYAEIPFNNVFAFLLLSTLGVSAAQTIHFVTVSWYYLAR